jgi:hypothetical protein
LVFFFAGAACCCALFFFFFLRRFFDILNPCYPIGVWRLASNDRRDRRGTHLVFPQITQIDADVCDFVYLRHLRAELGGWWPV